LSVCDCVRNFAAARIVCEASALPLSLAGVPNNFAGFKEAVPTLPLFIPLSQHRV
jgi:hypothetical protein